MNEWFVFASAAAAVLFSAGIAMRGARNRRLARERLFENLPESAEPEGMRVAENRRFARRRVWISWGIAIVVIVLLRFVVRIPWTFSGAAGFLTGLLGSQLDAFRVATLEDRIEHQLADAIDLMISALKVGSSQQEAMERCAQEAGQPLRRELDEVVGRLRYGDNPQEVLGALSERVPLETFRLFSLTLAVNWDVGGRLSGTLAAVGRTIRDRIELTRRLRAMTTQSRVSVIAILMASYFIAALMWRNDPDRMSRFLASGVGQALTMTAMILQGVGVVWISRMSQAKF